MHTALFQLYFTICTSLYNDYKTTTKKMAKNYGPKYGHVSKQN